MRIKGVKSKEDFILFLKQLAIDFEENSDEWENIRLSSYMESMAAWIEDTDETNLEGDKWEVLSRIILAPKSYE